MKKNLLLVFLLICGLINAQEGYNTLVYEGNAAFNQKNYERASSKFSEAAKLKEKDFTSHYNLGNSLYKRKMYNEARAEFQKAENFATTLPDKMAAEYNIGNTFMKTQNPEKAAEYYKKALKQDPNNESAQRNYQIAKLKEKEKNEQKQNGKSGGNGKDKDQNKDNKDQKGKNPSQQNGGNIQNMAGNGNDGNNPGKKPNPGKMPKELEKALLERTENKEHETAQKILNKNTNLMPQSNEKDW